MGLDAKTCDEGVALEIYTPLGIHLTTALSGRPSLRRRRGSTIEISIQIILKVLVLRPWDAPNDR